MELTADLTPIIAEMKAGTYRPEISERTINEHTAKNVDLWLPLKPERNALTTIAIEEIWQSFKKTRKSMLKNASEHEPVSFNEIKEPTLSAFEDAVTRWKKKKDQRLKNPYNQWQISDALYQRLTLILKHGAETGCMYPSDTIEDFLRRGINTSGHTIWATIAIVPTLARLQGIQISKDQAIRTIKAAYGPVISMLSHMNQSLVSHISHVIENERYFQFDPQYFQLKVNGDGWRLLLDHSALMNVNFRGEKITQIKPLGDTTWCPAQYSNGESRDVIHELFEWDLALASQSYIELAQLPKSLI